MGIGSFIVHFQKSQIPVLFHGILYCQEIRTWNINVLAHDGVKLPGDLLGDLHEFFAVPLFYQRKNLGLLQKTAVFHIIAGIDPVNMGFQKIRQIRSQIQYRIRKHRHPQSRIHDMYNGLTDPDLIF